MAKKMKNQNPPRRVEIRGQDHLLAYITPDEAQLLMDNGGSGEPGPMGIPAFVRGFGGETSEQEARDSGAGGISKDDVDRGNQDANDRQSERESNRQIADEIANRQAYEAMMGGIAPGQATAMFGNALMAGTGFTSADIDRVLGDATVSREALAGILPELQARARRGEQISTLAGALSPVRTAFTGLLGKLGVNMPARTTSYDDLATLISMPESRIQPGGLFSPDEVLAAPTGGVGAFGTPANLSQGYFGGVSYTGMPNEDYTGPFADLVNPEPDSMGGDRDVIPPQINSITGEAECQLGYTYDSEIGMCIKDRPIRTPEFRPGPAYARTGLLDVAPTGGLLEDFDRLNRQFQLSYATRPSYYQDPYNLQGMKRI